MILTGHSDGKLRKKVFERTRQVTDLNQQLTSNFHGTVDLVCRLSNMHSQMLGHHSRRVADLSVKIVQRRGLNDNLVQDLETSAKQQHDVGKIGMDPIVEGPYIYRRGWTTNGESE
ncbi:MAG: hypothetical protein WD423_10655 [Rhodothermales bacterium]